MISFVDAVEAIWSARVPGKWEQTGGEESGESSATAATHRRLIVMGGMMSKKGKLMRVGIRVVVDGFAMTR